MTWLYHCTTGDRVPSIRREGLKSSTQTRWEGTAYHEHSRGWLFSDEDPARYRFCVTFTRKDLILKGSGWLPVLLRFKRDGVGGDGWVDDEYGGGRSWKTQGRVPPEEIEGFDFSLREWVPMDDVVAEKLTNSAGTGYWGKAIDERGEVFGEVDTIDQQLKNLFEEAREAVGCGAGRRRRTTNTGRSMRSGSSRIKDRFVNSYLEAALASTDEDGKPLDRRFGVDDLDDRSRSVMEREAKQFLSDNWEDLQERAPEDGGIDFWLTRNGHGAGFWDGDWPRGVESRLTDASKEWGEQDLYVGDDGLLHLYGGAWNSGRRRRRRHSRMRIMRRRY